MKLRRQSLRKVLPCPGRRAGEGASQALNSVLGSIPFFLLFWPWCWVLNPGPCVPGSCAFPPYCILRPSLVPPPGSVAQLSGPLGPGSRLGKPWAAGEAAATLSSPGKPQNSSTVLIDLPRPSIPHFFLFRPRVGGRTSGPLPRPSVPCPALCFPTALPSLHSSAPTSTQVSAKSAPSPGRRADGFLMPHVLFPS